MGIVRDLYMARKIGAGLKLPAPTVGSLIKRLLLAKILYSDAKKTETGVLIHILDALAEPAIAAVVDIAPVQNLNGYTRPWPAGGGENKWEPKEGTSNGVTFTLQGDGSVEISGETTSASNPYVYQVVDLPWNGISAGDDVVLWSDKYNVVICYEGSTNILSKFSKDGVAETFTIPASATNIRMSQYAKSTTPTAGEEFDTTGHYYLAKADAFTAWSPYENICPISGLTGLSVYVSPTQDVADATTYNVDWTSAAGTVYGGAVDIVTGVLTVDMASVDLGTLTWTLFSSGFRATLSGAKAPETIYELPKALCSDYPVVPQSQGNTDKTLFFTVGGYLYVKDTSYSDAATFKTAMDGVQLVYELATPVTHQLTAQEVQMLLGENYIWSSSGDSMSVTYLADGNATPLESLNLMLGNRYSNPGTVEDVSDREALEILLGR